MRTTTKPIAILAGLALSLACAAAHGPGRPSFDGVAARFHADPWNSDPCGFRRPLAGICRMLRPVSG
jgi:hypothetical protein